MMPEALFHPIPPLFDANSRVLILGTFPSPKSREAAFFYGHPQNRFWPVLAAVLGESAPQSTQEKRMMALKHGVALWDVLASCEISGASDTSIKNPVANDLAPIFSAADIGAVFATGAKAHTLYTKLTLPATNRPAIRLPSTSPANCAASFDQLVSEYRRILDFL